MSLIEQMAILITFHIKKSKDLLRTIHGVRQSIRENRRLHRVVKKELITRSSELIADIRHGLKHNALLTAEEYQNRLNNIETD